MENKSSNINKKIDKVTNTINELTNKQTTLEESITNITNRITNIKVEIEHITTTTNTLVKERDEKRTESKVVSSQESTKLLEEIEALTK